MHLIACARLGNESRTPRERRISFNFQDPKCSASELFGSVTRTLMGSAASSGPVGPPWFSSLSKGTSVSWEAGREDGAACWEPAFCDSS